MISRLKASAPRAQKLGQRAINTKGLSEELLAVAQHHQAILPAEGNAEIAGLEEIKNEPGMASDPFVVETYDRNTAWLRQLNSFAQ